jgi:hypothetical protein
MNIEEFPNDREVINNMMIDEANEIEKEMLSLKKIDRGYNKVYRNIPRASDGKIINTKIDVYTTGSIGSRIRDADTGEYYNYKVGSRDEDLFFKVSLATGECNSKNGSNTLFYLSPHHYMSHLNVELDDSVINSWEEKRNIFLKNNKKTKSNNSE